MKLITTTPEIEIKLEPKIGKNTAGNTSKNPLLDTYFTTVK